MLHPVRLRDDLTVNQQIFVAFLPIIIGMGVVFLFRFLILSGIIVLS